MSSWKPSEGLTKAEMLVQILEVEARAAGSVITPVFRHRMVEMIAKTLDGGVVGVMTVTKEQVYQWTNRDTLTGDVIASDATPTTGFTNGLYETADAPVMGRVHEADVPGEIQPTPKKAKAAKPAKKPGKRGRPSKAEVEARKAAGT